MAKKKRALPPNVHHKHGQYWFVQTLPGRKRKWVPLGKDKYSALNNVRDIGRGATTAGTVRQLLEDYLKNMPASLAPTTQQAYRKRARRLDKVFGHVPARSV